MVLARPLPVTPILTLQTRTYRTDLAILIPFTSILTLTLPDPYYKRDFAIAVGYLYLV